jgi:cytochrome c biogenesis protein CcdA
MLRLIGIVVSIGLADSLNPTTIAPALYLASGEGARERVAEFTVAVFVVYFLGGALIALGPGQLLLALVPKPDNEDKHVIEIVAGAAMLVAALLLWLHRDRLSDRKLPAVDAKGRSSAILGATITAVELPTAFPYFAAIAAIVGSDLSVPKQLILLLLFNVCFILPLIGIVATLAFAGDRADRILATGRDFLQRHWPAILAGISLLAGIFVLVLGITAFTQNNQTRFGRFMKRLRHLIHP